MLMRLLMRAHSERHIRIRGQNVLAPLSHSMALSKKKPDDYRAALYLGIALSRTKDKDAEAALKRRIQSAQKSRG